MKFENYEIKEVSQEDSFLGEILEGLHWTLSKEVKTINELHRIISRQKEGELKVSLRKICRSLEDIFTDTEITHKSTREEWKRRGEPLSMRQQEIKKAAADKRDEILRNQMFNKEEK